MIAATNRTDAENISLAYATYDELDAVAALGQFFAAQSAPQEQDREDCEHCGANWDITSCSEACEAHRGLEDDGGPEEVV